MGFMSVSESDEEEESKDKSITDMSIKEKAKNL